MNKFKVGDRVKVIKLVDDYLSIATTKDCEMELEGVVTSVPVEHIEISFPYYKVMPDSIEKLNEFVEFCVDHEIYGWTPENERDMKKAAKQNGIEFLEEELELITV